jgi:hypothetical protein
MDVEALLAAAAAALAEFDWRLAPRVRLCG